MTLSLSLAPDVESKLRQRAHAAGQDLTAYAATIIEQAMNRHSLEELLAPLRAEFEASRTTEDELVEQITQARDAYRNQR